MKIIGITCIGPDPSVCVMDSGKILSMVEEERITRIKHANVDFPKEAFKFCLNQSGLTIEEIDVITYPWEASKFSSGYIQKFYDSINQTYDKDDRTLEWEKEQLTIFNEDALRRRILSEVKNLCPNANKLPEVVFTPHHYSHAFQSYFMSKMKKSLIFTIDGSGDENCTVIWKGESNQLTKLKEYNIPHSLGWFYAAFTEFLGFKAYDGEYKVMGLAAYGTYDEKLINKVNQVLSYDANGNYKVNPYFIFYGEHTYSGRYTDKMVELFGEPNVSQSVSSYMKNVAFAIQFHLEEVCCRQAKYWVEKTGIRNICLGGGVAMNVKMAGRLRQEDFVDQVFVPYCSSDLGLSLGSAMVHSKNSGIKLDSRLDSPFWGPSFNNDFIEGILKECKLKYKKVEKVGDIVAKLLAEQKIVGWFQGRGEVGARALGSRSILADPRKVENKDRVNKVIKQRELWRPFCPSILEDRSTDYFEGCTRSPYMTMTFHSMRKTEDTIPAVVHIDKTVRPQTVNKTQGKEYYRMLNKFYELTGVPVVLNTSFNVKEEPIVHHPLDAIRCFYSNGLDVLAIGNFILEK